MKVEIVAGTSLHQKIRSLPQVRSREEEKEADPRGGGGGGGGINNMLVSINLASIRPVSFTFHGNGSSDLLKCLSSA